jgi:predicted RNase H-like nuclease (RuvC/YqgF family)
MNGWLAQLLAVPAPAAAPGAHLTGTQIVVLGWAVSLAAGFAAYLLSGRSARAQAKASSDAVDAGAYQRAQGIYEGALQQQTLEIERLRERFNQVSAEVSALRAEVTRQAVIREENERLSSEVRRLMTVVLRLEAESQRLTEENARLRREGPT